VRVCVCAKECSAKSTRARIPPHCLTRRSSRACLLTHRRTATSTAGWCARVITRLSFENTSLCLSSFQMRVAWFLWVAHDIIHFRQTHTEAERCSLSHTRTRTHARTHTNTHARTHAHTHARTQMHCASSSRSPSLCRPRTPFIASLTCPSKSASSPVRAILIYA
jgi:hypothetical protein